MSPPVSLGDEIEWRDGHPISRRFGDVYFSRESGIGEARHVFLDGNDLGARWSRLAPGAHFVIGEIGFGTGLNFAAAWDLWRATAPPDGRLHFMSVERYPLATTEIERALDPWPQLEGYRRALCDRWERFAPGWHRLSFDRGRLLLTLLVGDARELLGLGSATVDAWFLDGFAPARNPEAWTPDVLAQVARLARRGTTVATYTVAGEVRRGLERVGFEVHQAPGFGRKRAMLRGVLRATPPRPWRAPWLERPRAPSSSRRAIVVGAGLAGAATAASLAARGWEVTVVERQRAPAGEASGNHQGVLYAHPSPHPSALNTLVLSGLQHTCRVLRDRLADRNDAFSPCGVIQLAFDAAEEVRQGLVADAGLPRELLHCVDRAEASARGGVALPHGGMLFPRAGWVHPPALCESLLTAPNIRLVLNRAAIDIQRDDSGWTLRDREGPVAAAPIAVIAAPSAVASFDVTRELSLRAIRGQLTLVPATAASRALQTVVCGKGYVAPARANLHSVGATHRSRDPGIDVRPEENAENLSRLRSLAPALHAALGAETLDPAGLAARAALRWSSPDYLPIVGPVADASVFAIAYAQLRHGARSTPTDPAPWLDGLHVNTAHGSRGLVTAPLAGELLAAYLDDEPAPLPSTVVDALHPSRFLLRALIRRKL